MSPTAVQKNKKADSVMAPTMAAITKAPLTLA